ncbi:polyprenyl synthetase family protein [bacterium]|nr:polyprenyl synthetase family protein [bacterium]
MNESPQVSGEAIEIDPGGSASVDLREEMERERLRIEAALEEYLEESGGPDDGRCPERLAAAMKYSLMAGGKRLRPLLTLWAAEACGATAGIAMPAAVALEMIHTYSLIHDDLPAMDDDDLRRGRPTCHKAFDEATAILAGDGLLTLAFEVVARHQRPRDCAGDCIAILAEAAGPKGMVGGQMADLEAETRDDATLDELEAIHRRKTGALLSAALRMGATVAGAGDREKAALAEYGRNVGLAFQVVDDLLDATGDEAKMGKRVGKDSGLGKWTYPGLMGIEASRAYARELTASAIESLAVFEGRADRLRALAHQIVERDH